MKKGGVKFHEGVPELSQLETWFPRGGVAGTGRFNDMKEETIKKSWTFLPKILIIKTFR